MRDLIKVVSKRLFIWSILFNTIYSIADYGQAFVLSYCGTSPLTLDKITNLTIAIIILNIIALLSSKIGYYIDNVNDVKCSTSIEKYYFNKVQSMTMEKVVNTHTGYIRTLITEVSSLLVDLTWYFEVSVIPLIIGGISILSMVCKQSFLTGILFIIIASLAVSIKYIMLKKNKIYDKAVRSKNSKYNATFVDFVQNTIAVRKLNISPFCNRKLNESSQDYINSTKQNVKKISITNGVFNEFIDLLYLVVLFSTISIVKNGQDGLPYLLFYMSALGKTYKNLNMVVRLIDTSVKFKTAKEQLDNYFNGSSEVNVINEFNDIKLSNVIFSYTKDSTKIKIPEFILNKGDKISITGESGQGKTTTMNILAGLFPLENGNLFINGNVCTNTRADLVFVSQEVDLFDLSIKDNLCLGKDIPEEKILELLNEAGLMKWYNSLPNGLDTMVGEKGIKLSAGQKQRLNLIRGILIDKDLYFFDEPTSNLDSISEQRITNMIEKYLKDKTYVIVTHRPKLKELCNKHYIFEDHIMKEVIYA